MSERIVLGGGYPKKKKDKGLGDTVERVIKALGFTKKCKPCKRRKAILNKIFPYK